MAQDIIEVKYKADVEGYEREIKEAIGTNTEFQKSVDKAQKEVNQGFDPKKPKEYAKSVEQVDKKVKNVGKSTGQLGGIAAKVGPALAAAFAVDRIISLGKQIVDVTARFQKYSAVLTNTLGDKSKAQQALQMISDFAAKTPYAVDELTASFVKFANQGFNPTAEEMRKLGDVAASQGKSFDMLTEAIIDAQTGEFERLKEFGIRASKEGDRVTFAFKGVKTQTDFTSDSIRNYILSLGDLEGVSGGMAAVSETLGGKISNLGDSFDQLFMTIGSQGDGVLSFFIEGVATEVEHLRNVLMTAEQTFAADRLSARGKERESLLRMTETWDEEEINALIAKQREQQRLLIQAADVARKNEDERSEQEFNSEISRLEMRVQIAKEILDERKISAEKEIEVEKERWDKGKKEREKANKERLKDEMEFQALVIENMAPGVEKELALEQLKYEKQKIALGNNYRAIEELTKQHQARMGEIMSDDLMAEAEKHAENLENQREFEKKYQQMQIDDLNAQVDKMAEIEMRGAEEQKERDEAELERKREMANAQYEIASSLTSSLSSLGKIFIKDKEKQAAFEKTLAIFQLGIDTAKAISSGIASSQSVPYPGNLVAIATTVATVLANVAQASQLLSSSNPPSGYKDGVIDLQGPGTSRSDSIPALLSKGESVITADKTKRYMDELRAMNRNNFEDLITTKYVLPQLRAMQQGNSGERMAASMGFNYDDSDLIHTIKRQKTATTKDIQSLEKTIKKALTSDKIRAKYKWRN